jgi:predicted DNA-binding transcriptional regulator YafY
MGQSTSNSRGRIARIRQIHQKLAAHAAPNATTLAKELGVSIKTIQRDIAEMRNHGYPIEYDPVERAYSCAGGVHDFPFLQISDSEMLALLVAEKMLRQYRGTPLEGPLRTVLSKLAEMMETTMEVDLHATASTLSTRWMGEVEMDGETFAFILKAATERREVTFEYAKLGGVVPEKRRVRPYHIHFVDGLWYMEAYDLDRSDMRRFAIARIVETGEFGEGFELPSDYSPEAVMRATFGAYSGTGDYRVRIQFDRFASRLVGERDWPASAEKTYGEDGLLTLTLRVNALEEVERWVLSWGEHAEVLEPEELRHRVKAIAEAVVARYEGLPPWMGELREIARHYCDDDVLRLISSLEKPLSQPGQAWLPLCGSPVRETR